jgi:hypothetical protein
MMRLLLIIAAAIVGAILLLLFGAIAGLIDDELVPTDDPLVEYGKLMRWRAALIDEGVPAFMLDTPLYPDAAEWVHG